MKENKHLGVYGLLIEDNKILLVKKKTGPYDGKLDLPGGTIEFGETPTCTLKMEIKEETGLDVIDYTLYDSSSVLVEWIYDNDKIITHHIGIFYKINSYNGEMKKDIEITDINDDSLGANFYEIDKLTKNMLSKIALLELEKLGYDIK